MAWLCRRAPVALWRRSTVWLWTTAPGGPVCPDPIPSTAVSERVRTLGEERETDHELGRVNKRPVVVAVQVRVPGHLRAGTKDNTAQTEYAADLFGSRARACTCCCLLPAGYVWTCECSRAPPGPLLRSVTIDPNTTSARRNHTA